MSELERRLPHRRTMLLLDELVEADALHAVCRVHIGPESSFFQAPDGVPAWVGLEYMAQTVAVIGGTRALESGRPAPDGMLLGSRRYTCNKGAFESGSILTVSATELAFDSNGIGAYNCSIESAGIRADARLTIYQKPENIVE